MNFEDAEIDNSGTPSGKGKILGVIVLTDNRINKSIDKNNNNDFRCSAYKGINLHTKKLKLTLCNLRLVFLTLHTMMI
jgi:hypothetical protein